MDQWVTQEVMSHLNPFQQQRCRRVCRSWSNAVKRWDPDDTKDPFYKIFHEPFVWGCHYGDLGVVNYQMRHNSISDPEMEHGFRETCRNGHIQIAETLLKTGLCDREKGLYFACEYGHRQLVKFLTQQKNPILSLYGLNGACQGGHQDLIEMMAEGLGTVSNTSFYLLCRWGHHHLIDWFINKYNAHKFLESGLNGACEGRSIETVKKILSYGLEKVKRRGFETAFHYACSNDDQNIMKLLIQHVNTQSTYCICGKTFENHINK
jgi:ankyrin repeat protein